jgi:ubiquinone/menaquinone biosynthesis C-methylase UbiE
MNNKGKKEWQASHYVCPVSKQLLTPKTNGLFCQQEGVEYPVKNGIPDFVVEDLTESTNPVLRSVDKIDEFAKIYEGPLVYGIVDKVNAELGLPSTEDMAKTMTEMVDAENGVGLDVACGTGFVTRHLAQKMHLVYGIDISMGMLEEATKYAQEKGIGNIRFARSMAEKLPFPDDVFDGVTCSGALHLFQDTVEALREMARVMKRSARLAVLTVVKGDLPVLKTVFERVGTSNPLAKEALKTMHIFDIEGLDRYLSQIEFKGFTYDIYGPFILFNAEKG